MSVISVQLTPSMYQLSTHDQPQPPMTPVLPPNIILPSLSTSPASSAYLQLRYLFSANLAPFGLITDSRFHHQTKSTPTTYTQKQYQAAYLVILQFQTLHVRPKATHVTVAASTYPILVLSFSIAKCHVPLFTYGTNFTISNRQQLSIPLAEVAACFLDLILVVVLPLARFFLLRSLVLLLFFGSTNC